MEGPVFHESKPNKEIAFDKTRGDWRVTGSYDEPDNIVFYHKGELFRAITYPGYKIWNIAAHFEDYIPELETELQNSGSPAMSESKPSDVRDNGRYNGFGLTCFDCGKQVTPDLSNHVIVRGTITCPECEEKESVETHTLLQQEYDRGSKDGYKQGWDSAGGEFGDGALTREYDRGEQSGAQIAKDIVLQATGVPADARNPTRDEFVIWGERIVAAIDAALKSGDTE